MWIVEDIDFVEAWRRGGVEWRREGVEAGKATQMRYSRVVNLHVLQPAAVGSKTLVEGDDVTCPREHEEKCEAWLFRHAPFWFFQLEMHGGIFQSACSFAVTCT